MGCATSSANSGSSRDRSSSASRFDKKSDDTAALQSALAARLAMAAGGGGSARAKQSTASTTSLSDIFTPLSPSEATRFASTAPPMMASPKLVTTKADLRRSSSVFITRSRNVLLLFPVIPDTLPTCLKVAPGMRHSGLRVCMGHCCRQGKRDHMEDRVAVCPTGLRLNCTGPVAPAPSQSCHQRVVELATEQDMKADDGLVIMAANGDGHGRLEASTGVGGGGGGGGGGATRAPSPSQQHGAAVDGNSPASAATGPEFCFAGVYDGHGGYKTAEFLKAHLHTAVAQRLCTGGDHTQQLAQAFADVDSEVCHAAELCESGSCAVVACVIPRVDWRGSGAWGKGGSQDSLGLGATVVEAVDEEDDDEGAVVCATVQGAASPASDPRVPSPATVSNLSLRSGGSSTPDSGGGGGAGGAGAGTLGVAVLTPSPSRVAPGGRRARKTAETRLLFGDDGGSGGEGDAAGDVAGGAAAAAGDDDGNPRVTPAVNKPYRVQHANTEGSRPALQSTPARHASPARLLIAHVGDSAAILCRAGTAEAVCVPHKPTNAKEAARIQAAGGMVAPTGRIHGILDTSRAFGDVGFKASFKESGNLLHNGNVVVSTPDVMEFDLLPSDEFLLLASDGLLSVMNMQQAVNVVKRELLEHRDVERAAEVLVQQAINTQLSRDNVSVVIMCFHQASPDEC